MDHVTLKISLNYQNNRKDAAFEITLVLFLLFKNHIFCKFYLESDLKMAWNY